MSILKRLKRIEYQMDINKGKLRIETSINCSRKLSDEQSITAFKKEALFH